ncbi:MAG: hypothetical protein F6K36_04215 [Symploca sp. SIO3C6]|nr:hypothetical protein [Symploca sp. SIO3C6]NET05990.1 hypothetical protein [Symploca sp. SIO2B6]
MNTFDDPVLPNYSYLGYSYNILKLDPTDLMEIESDKNLKDDPPPATNPRNVVDLNAQGFEPAGDQPYLKPKNTIYLSTPSMTDEVFAKYQRNVSEYYEQHTSALSLGLGLFGGIFGFTFSRSYNRFVQESTDKTRLAVYSHQYVQNHRLALSESENAVVDQIKRYFKLGQEFQNRVKELPNSRDDEEDREKYKNFIEDVGTHYTWQVGFGGRKNNYSYISKDSYERLEGEGTNVNLGAEWSFKKITGQVGADFEEENMRRFQEEAADYYHKIVTEGGSVGIADLEDWVQTIPDNPVPVKIKIALVYELLIPELFEDEPEINLKRQLMEDAYQDYLKENGIPGETRPVLTVVYDYNDQLYQCDYTALEWPPEENNNLEWNKGIQVAPSAGQYHAVAWYENKETLYSVFFPMYPMRGLGYSEVYQFGWATKLLSNNDTSIYYSEMALAEFNDKLYCVFVATPETPRFCYTSFDRNNNAWTSPKQIGNYVPKSSPAIAAYNNKLYLACRHEDNLNEAYYSLIAMDKSENWEHVYNAGHDGELRQLGIALFEDKLVVGVTNTNKDGRYMLRYSVYKDDKWLGGGSTPTEDPAFFTTLMEFNNKLFFVYNTNDRRLFFCTAEFDSHGTHLRFSQHKRIMNNNALFFDVAVRKSNLPLFPPKMN